MDTEVKREGHSDFLSRGLSYHSNGRDAEGLDFWVRNGDQVNTFAVTVHPSLFESDRMRVASQIELA